MVSSSLTALEARQNMLAPLLLLLKSEGFMEMTRKAGFILYSKTTKSAKYGTLTYIVNIMATGIDNKPETWQFRSCIFEGPTLNARTGSFIQREAIGAAWHSLRGTMEGVASRYRASVREFKDKEVKLHLRHK